MSDSGFLQEPTAPETVPESPPAAVETSASEAAAVVQVGAPEVTPVAQETPAPVAAIELPEGEDEVALAERQAAAQMAAEEETFLEQGEIPSTEGMSALPPEETGAAGAASTGSASPAVIAKDEVTVEVEKILEQGLQPYYEQLPEAAQLRFRQKGVEVSTQIANMVRAFHVQAKKVLKLIRDWLLTIPGVNRFFLEQEAKIKTDRIAELERARREDAQNKP